MHLRMLVGGTGSPGVKHLLLLGLCLLCRVSSGKSKTQLITCFLWHSHLWPSMQA